MIVSKKALGDKLPAASIWFRKLESKEVLRSEISVLTIGI